MGKSRKSRSSVVNKTFKTAKNVVDTSIPVIEKGVGVVYGTMSTGLDLGVKTAKSLTRSASKKSSRKISRARSLAGGKRRSRRYRRHY